MTNVPPSTIVLGDGTSALIRPIEPTDAPTLQAFHERQSPESRYRRYFSPKPVLTDDELERFTTVDFVDRAALVVEQHDEFIAWASYERWQNRGDAEVAFQVDDGHQGKGIATLLLEHLAAIAQDNEIERFTAQTLGENRAMLSVFSKAGWPVHRRFDSGVIDVDFSLDETAEFIDSVERREHRADSRAVAHLLLPSSIAVIGASDRPDSIGAQVWQHVLATDRIRSYAVNPRLDEIDGRPCYDAVGDIPDDVGLAVVAVPQQHLEATIDQCIDKRVRGAIVITVVEPDTIDMRALVSRARRNGLRIVGPASMGIASPRPDVEIQAALVDVRLPPGKVAVSMQSGTLGTSLLRLAAHLHLGLSWFVSLGDKDDLSANDLLQFWEDDDATEVIALYTESFGNPRKFARIARRVSRSKPIVAVRAGAALLDPANATLYRQTGVIEVPTVTAMLDTARVFACQPLMDGDRVAVLSNSRSPAVLAEATLTRAGLTPVVAPVALDWASTPDDYESAVRTTLADDDIDALLVVHAPPSTVDVNAPSEAIDRAASGADKPVVAVMLGSGDGPLRPGSDIASFAFPEQAAAALARVDAYSRWRRTEVDESPDEVPANIDRLGADDVIDEMIAGDATGPQEARRLLATYGIEMAPTRRVDAGDAVAAADELGYPVAVKAAQRRIGRSVEAGIALDLADADDVAEAISIMRQHLGDDAATVEVQRMLPPGTDLRVRVEDDERLGPIITVGLGGVQADLIGDEISRLAPVSPVVARRMVEATRASGALDDDTLTRVADLVARIAHLASDHPRLQEIDVNPVIVSEGHCHVADVVVRLGTPDRHEPVRRLET
ncbi:MAG: GNAT family N-acetyltransferase [Ilumatobacter fluminis]|uniref:bifunctional acetate--CoA ligase family protein/GNAT family N-acetyltransferase n=1 Tax=Ilumatobacter fluminis TaxID=467091 RepID=UPI0032EF6D7D